MPASQKPQEVELIVCEVCLKEVPVTEATVPEASDYVVYFCGLECYEKWKTNPPGDADKKGDDPAS